MINMNTSNNIQDNDNNEIVDTTKVSCSGIGGSLGHPKVYLDMGDEKTIRCPYCSKLFILENS